MCPSSGADDCVVLSPRVGAVPWLQEGCQNRLAGSTLRDELLNRHTISANIKLVSFPYGSLLCCAEYCEIILKCFYLVFHRMCLIKGDTIHRSFLRGFYKTLADLIPFLTTTCILKYIKCSCRKLPQPNTNVLPPCHDTTPTRGDNTTLSSAPEDGNMVARNMLSNL